MRLLATAIAALAFAAPSHADTWVLDFNGNICGAAGNTACGNYSEIGQNYGDVAGLLDVSHRSAHASTLLTYEPFLKFWSTGYSNLQSIAWGGGNASAYVAEISFMPTAGNLVTLNSFDFGDYQNRSFGSSAVILDAGTQQLLWSSGSFDPGAASPASFLPNISSANGLILRWGPDSYDTGIDNISVSISPVPEPAAWLLMAGGLALFAARQRISRSV